MNEKISVIGNLFFGRDKIYEILSPRPMTQGYLTMQHHSAPDSILSAFLSAQHRAGMALAAESDLLNLIPFGGTPPNRYVAEFSCRGLVRSNGEIVEHDFWAVGITFPSNYLRQSLDVANLLTYLGPHPEPWSPNMQIGGPPSLICLHVGNGSGLLEILGGLFDLITWNLYSTSDEGLNHEAAQWCRNQLSEVPDRFPVDRRPLKTLLPPRANDSKALESEASS